MVDAADIAPYISLAFLFVVGLGLGASTTFDAFRQAFAKPKAVGVGFLSQYLFMPIAAYLLTLIFQVDVGVAVGAVLIGCSPGGTTSNLFTYWSHGDVALSITMSFLSTCAAFLFMPFWIWVLVKQALGSSAQIAWLNMISSLLLILIPTIVGLLVRKHNTQTKLAGKFLWKWVELLATVLGILFLIASVVIALVAYGNLFKETPYQVWIMAAIMQPLGCAFGYYVSWLLSFPRRDVRAISLETGVQNFALTIAVIQLSFEGDALKTALMFPVAYGFLYLFWSPALVLLFRYHLAPKDPPAEDVDEENEKKIPSNEGDSSETEQPNTMGNDSKTTCLNRALAGQEETKHGTNNEVGDDEGNSNREETPGDYNV